MADREKVMQWLEACASGCEEGCPYEYENLVYRVECKADLMRDALALLEEQETVVRCKDCKYNSGNCHGLYAQFVTCYKTGSPHMENWYCADGERR